MRFSKLAFAPVLYIFLLFGFSCGSITNEKIVLGATDGISAVAGDKSATISWNSFPGADSYALYWGLESGISGENSYITVDQTSYTHTGLANYTTYYYKVATISSTGDIGALSDEASATPNPALPSKPANLVATPGDSSVSLLWSAASLADSYRIYWNTIGSVTSIDAYISSANPAVNHSGLTNDTTYYYRVSGVNSDGEGPLSDEASATPKEGLNTGCIGAHTPPAGLSVSISIAHCSPRSNYTINSELTGYNLNRGQLTARIIGVGDTNVPNGAIFMLMYGADSAGNLENAHMMLWGSGNTKNVRLVRHYWNPDLSAKLHQGTFVWRPSVTYTVDCSWDVSTFSCQITGSDGTSSMTFSVPWVAPFAKIAHTGFQFGNKIYGGRTIGSNPRVTAIRFTAFR